MLLMYTWLFVVGMDEDGVDFNGLFFRLTRVAVVLAKGNLFNGFSIKKFICQFLVMVNTQNRTLNLFQSLSVQEILNSKSYEEDGED